MDLGIRRKHNRRRYDRAGKRPDAHLIDSCNVHDAGFPENSFEMQHRIKPFPLFGLLLEAPRKRVVQLPGARTRIPL